MNSTSPGSAELQLGIRDQAAELRLVCRLRYGLGPRWRGDKLAIRELAGIVRFMTQAALSELLQLPKPQRLAVAERLWLSVADEASMPVPESHKRVLRKRLADYRAGTAKTISHEELMRRVRAS